MKKYCYCRVQPKGMDTTFSYISDDMSMRIGAHVEIPFGFQENIIKGTVMGVNFFTVDQVPFPVDRTKHIIRELSPDEFWEGEIEKGSDFSGKVIYEDAINELEEFLSWEDYEEVYNWACEYRECLDSGKIMERVVSCFELCIGQNMPEAAFKLGEMYEKGMFVNQDYKKAFYFYKIAADAGILRAICNCGYSCYYGRHEEVDYEKAYSYFSKGVILYNDGNCLYKLGDMYYHGYYVEKNDKYAYMLYVRALKLCKEDPELSYCLADARLRVGGCLLYGITVVRDPEKAFGLLSDALAGFYERRKQDAHVRGLIEQAKKLMEEASSLLDEEIL